MNQLIIVRPYLNKLILQDEDNNLYVEIDYFHTLSQYKTKRLEDLLNSHPFTFKEMQLIYQGYRYIKLDSILLEMTLAKRMRADLVQVRERILEIIKENKTVSSEPKESKASLFDFLSQIIPKQNLEIREEKDYYLLKINKVQPVENINNSNKEPQKSKPMPIAMFPFKKKNYSV